MLLPREKQIVELLYSSKKIFTTSELASAMQISSRTIKEDLKKIRLELTDSGCEIKTKPGKGVWLDFTPKGKKYLNGLMLKSDNASSILHETRKYFIALQILDSSNFISMESISESLYVSKGTVVNDINKLEPLFESFQLELERAVKYGIRIIGTERQIRIAKAHIVRKIVVYQGNEMVKKLQPLFGDIDLKAISELIQTAENKFDFILSDTSYINLLIHTALIVERIKKGYICNQCEVDLFKDHDSREWAITNYFRVELTGIFNIFLLKGDVDYLYMNIIGSKYQDRSIFANNDVAQIRKISPGTFDGVQEIIREVDAIYGEDLCHDDSFMCAIFIHINAMFTRLMNSINLENPLRGRIKRDLTYEYEIATHISSLLKRDYYFDLSDDDICDLTLYVGAAIKRKNARMKALNPTVVIVCGSGMSTSQFVEAKLKLYFPHLVVKDILPLSRVSSLNRGSQDLIISTVPLELPGLNIISISPMLGNEDINKISDFFNPYRKIISPNKSKFAHLLSKLSDSILIIQCDCRSKEEVIRLLGTRMNHEGYVDEGYIDSVFKRENLSNTAIGDGFAIPHSFAGHVVNEGIGLMVLKKPITWGKEKVRVVFMIALDPDGQDSLKDIFEEMTNITSDYAIIDKLFESQSYNEFVGILS